MVNPGLNQRGDSDHNEGQPLIAERADPKEMTELLPCPQCGGRAFITISFGVMCEVDRCLMLPPRENRAEALAAWNERVPTTDREKLVRAVVERCAEEVERVAQDFLSPEYACPQPIGSVQERFACNTAASAIRSLNIDDLVKEARK